MPSNERLLDFEVKIACRINPPSPNPSYFSYKIGIDGLKTYPISNLQYASPCTTTSPSSTFSYSYLLNDGSPVPTFINLDLSSPSFTVGTSDLNLAGTYTIKVKATLNDEIFSSN